MKHVFDQLLRFLQQGIAAIFHFVQLIWTWSVDQISHLMAVPLAGVAAVEAGSAGPDHSWRAVGALQSRYRALESRCGDPGGIRAPAWRARPNAAPCILGGDYRARRRVASQPLRQFIFTDTELDAGQRPR
jgi:hypothetical protein